METLHITCYRKDGVRYYVTNDVDGSVPIMVKRVTADSWEVVADGKVLESGLSYFDAMGRAVNVAMHEPAEAPAVRQRGQGQGVLRVTFEPDKLDPDGVLALLHHLNVTCQTCGGWFARHIDWGIDPGKRGRHTLDEWFCENGHRFETTCPVHTIDMWRPSPERPRHPRIEAAIKQLLEMPPLMRAANLYLSPYIYRGEYVEQDQT